MERGHEVTRGARRSTRWSSSLTLGGTGGSEERRSASLRELQDSALVEARDHPVKELDRIARDLRVAAARGVLTARAPASPAVGCVGPDT